MRSTGCMVVVPRNALPDRTADHFANDMSSLEPSTWRAMLQASRALPARAGSVLGWDFQVIHWSSVVGDAEAPRVSLAVEAFGEDIVPAPGEEPLLDPGALPRFESAFTPSREGSCRASASSPEC